MPAEVGPVTTMRTSGTTGSPFEFQNCMLARIAAECMMHRHYTWHGFDFTAPMASVRFFSSGRGSPDGVTEQSWSAVRPGATHHTLDVREPVGEIVAWLTQRAPKYLLTFPSMMHDLVHHPDAAHLAKLKLGKVVGISESLTPHVRRSVREKLRCDVTQIYACAEMGCIALQAPTDDSYLVCEETVFVEVLNENGAAVEPGQTGRVVLTSLYNYATPFIRYEIGDYATRATNPSSCGRLLMRLERIDGRPRNALRTTNEHRIWPHEIPISELTGYLSTPHFQIRQPDRGNIELIIVAEKTAKPDEEEVGALFTRLLGNGVQVSVTAVNDLPRTKGGKRELCVSTVL